MIYKSIHFIDYQPREDVKFSSGDQIAKITCPGNGTQQTCADGKFLIYIFNYFFFTISGTEQQNYYYFCPFQVTLAAKVVLWGRGVAVHRYCIY